MDDDQTNPMTRMASRAVAEWKQDTTKNRRRTNTVQDYTKYVKRK